MAIITRRFLYRGPWPLRLKGALDPALTLPVPKFAVTYDVTYDDAGPEVGAVDSIMREYGCFPDAQNTIALSPDPFLGIVSPDGSTWKLSVSDLGILTTSKVSA